MFKLIIKNESGEQVENSIFETEEDATSYVGSKLEQGLTYEVVEVVEQVFVPPTQAQLDSLAAKAYLAKTDYIVLKIAEAVAEGDQTTVDALKVTYAAELAKRKVERAKVI